MIPYNNSIIVPVDTGYGTYIKDPHATAVRNAELDYLAEIKAEKQRRAEMEYLLELEKQEERARRKNYDRSR